MSLRTPRYRFYIAGYTVAIILHGHQSKLLPRPISSSDSLVDQSRDSLVGYDLVAHDVNS